MQYNFNYSKLELLEKYGIRRTSNNIFQNEKITVEFDSHGGGGSSFNIFNGIYSVKINYREREINFLNQLNSISAQYSSYKKNKYKNTSNILTVFYYTDYIRSIYLTRNICEITQRKDREKLFVQMLLEIFLSKEFLWVDLLKIKNLINDIKTKNKFRLAEQNKFKKEKLKIIKLIEKKYIEGKHDKRDGGYDHICKTTESFHLLYDDIVITDRRIDLLLPAIKISNAAYPSIHPICLLYDEVRINEEKDLLKNILKTLEN